MLLLPCQPMAAVKKMARCGRGVVDWTVLEQGRLQYYLDEVGERRLGEFWGQQQSFGA